MKIFDISSPIYEGMPVYKNKAEKQPKFITNTNGHVTESRIEMDAHTGTHIDAPLHMLNDGDTFESISLEKLVGQAKVVDLTNVTDGIAKSDLESLSIEKDDFILFKTSNSFDEDFNPEFIFLKEDGANYLAEIGIRGVGIDALGVERSQPNHPTHKALFKADIIVIEGLQLKDVEAKSYLMVAAPLKLIGIDASPARVILIENE
ncbi:cyclase family protein [Planomicrobium sp. CPCC 101110]|uniref:cyclase family protein n=1 Tax=Planomicrobium sp. CPCC 101110 TaxID=2599619 RepID=UPI0011B4E4D1|nr:cyclase family protein [Planomicrobium sp. CPCC 101110]TWT27481.1 cyclase family protein [Planomicrobium sp. CPCC 101110]